MVHWYLHNIVHNFPSFDTCTEMVPLSVPGQEVLKDQPRTADLADYVTGCQLVVRLAPFGMRWDTHLINLCIAGSSLAWVEHAKLHDHVTTSHLARLLKCMTFYVLKLVLPLANLHRMNGASCHGPTVVQS